MVPTNGDRINHTNGAGGRDHLGRGVTMVPEVPTPEHPDYPKQVAFEDHLGSEHFGAKTVGVGVGYSYGQTDGTHSSSRLPSMPGSSHAPHRKGYVRDGGVEEGVGRALRQRTPGGLA